MIEICRLMFNDEIVEVEIQACGFDLCFTAELIHEGRKPTLIQLTQPDLITCGETRRILKRCTLQINHRYCCIAAPLSSLCSLLCLC